MLCNPTLAAGAAITGLDCLGLGPLLHQSLIAFTSVAPPVYGVLCLREGTLSARLLSFFHTRPPPAAVLRNKPQDAVPL